MGYNCGLLCLLVWLGVFWVLFAVNVGLCCWFVCLLFVCIGGDLLVGWLFFISELSGGLVGFRV